MTRKINNSYELGQSNAPTDGGDMLKTRGDGTLVWEGVADTTFVPVSWYGSRGVFGSGFDGGANTNVIDYITISTPGNATDFGDITQARRTLDACSDGTTGIFGGGYTGSGVNTIDYITVATTGNATDFGDLTLSRYALASCSDGTTGIFGGGSTGSNTTTIDYITIATPGNAIDFGDITSARPPTVFLELVKLPKSVALPVTEIVT